jgi:nucleotide-binding universal stress UspA family protein
MIQSILLATDGSAPAERATDFAASLALRFGAALTVLYAHNPNSGHAGGASRPSAPDQALATAQALVSELAVRLHEMGIVSVDTEVVEGPANNVILGVAETRRPDLLVIGARGAGTWQGQFLGSVSMAVLQRAECPVLVVK